MTRVVLDAAGHEVPEARVEAERVEPRRVLLTLAEVDRLAHRCGVASPVPTLVGQEPAPDRVADRLGGGGSVQPGVPHDAQPPAPAAVDPTAVEVRLRELGLLDAEGRPHPEVSSVLDVWHAADLSVETDMVLDLVEGPARVRSVHRSRGPWLVCLTTADGERAELAWMDVASWSLELARLAWVDPTRVARPVEVELPDLLETPWELLLATGSAVRQHRPELLPALVAAHTGLTHSGARAAGGGGSPSPGAESAPDEEVLQWHRTLEQSSRGRLQAMVVGRSERGRPGVGVVQWVLFPDGWRSLEAFGREGWSMARVRRVTPADLGRDVAVRAAEVTT